MSPIARSLTNALLEHHHATCEPHGGRSVIVDRFVIVYSDLCTRAGLPGLERGIGRYLQEVAEWCQENEWPPLNSLAVNKDSRLPGDNYDVAPGCSLSNWQTEAERTILFRGYPTLLNET
jgi:hypothetical protein